MDNDSKCNDKILTDMPVCSKKFSDLSTGFQKFVKFQFVAMECFNRIIRNFLQLIRKGTMLNCLNVCILAVCRRFVHLAEFNNK